MPDKEAFYNSLNMEGITSFDDKHAKRVYKEFQSKNLGDYHDLHVQRDTLQMCLKTLGTSLLKCMNLILLNFCTRISRARLFKKDRDKIRIINQY